MFDLSWLWDLIGALIPIEIMQAKFLSRALVAVILLASAAAAMGTQVVALRLAFFTDAVGHSILAGIALGLVTGIAPGWSALGLAVCMGLAIVVLERRQHIDGATLTAVLFATIVAVGLVLLGRRPDAALLAQGFLSGDILTLDDGDIWALAGMWLSVFVLQFFAFNTLLLDALDPGLNQSSRRRAQFARAAFIILLSVLAMLAARTVGVLLATALLVLPAASARLATRSAARALLLSCAIGVVSGITGLLLSTVPAMSAPPGALMILCSSVIFVLMLVVKR